MTARFVTTLRSRNAAVRLVSADATDFWTLRVQCAEVWDAVKVEVLSAMPVRDVKQAAMAALMPDLDALDGYVVKLGGFEIMDERVSLQSAGVLDGSTLLIMARRRRPVR
jgi:hypothetical protein